MSRKFKFEIRVPSELSAGIRGFNDEVVVEVDSGDPGGVEGEFSEHMIGALREWYDGASVTEV